MSALAIRPVRALCLVAPLCLIACIGAARGSVDLEAPLRNKYVDKGNVASLLLVVPGLPAPVHYLASGPEKSEKVIDV